MIRGPHTPSNLPRNFQVFRLVGAERRVAPAGSRRQHTPGGIEQVRFSPLPSCLTRSSIPCRVQTIPCDGRRSTDIRACKRHVKSTIGPADHFRSKTLDQDRAYPGWQPGKPIAVSESGSHAEVVMVSARGNRRAGWRAKSRGVKIVVSKTRCSESIKRGCRRESTKGTAMTKAHIIDQPDKNVRSVLTGCDGFRASTARSPSAFFRSCLLNSKS